MSGEWWWALVRCPGCGDEPGDGGRCVSCGQSYRRRGNVVSWPSAPGEAPTLGRWRALVDPLRTPLLPFRYLTAVRTERYYQRTITDRALAERWAAHYLRDLPVPPQAIVLDFGCGRGRNVGLMTQLGHRVAGHDLRPHPWWNRLGGSGFQTSGDAEHLPWARAAFDLVVEVGVLHYLPAPVAARHVREIAGLIKPGGSWVLLEANAAGSGARAVRDQIGRLHDLETVRHWIADSGLREVDVTFEGYYAPMLPGLINYLRKQLSPRPLDIPDYDSLLARRTAPERRGFWRLRLQKPALATR